MSKSKKINPIANEVKQVFDGVYAQTQSFAKNQTSAINGLIVSGDAGTGKTFTVQKALKDLNVHKNVEYLKGGKVTAASLYVKLFLNKAPHRVLVLDDVDIVHHSEKNSVIPMLLGACDLGQNREVTWETTKKNAMMEEHNVPHKFQFQGTLIWITNDTVESIEKACKQWKHALFSRFNVSKCYFSDEQKLMYTLHLCEDVDMLGKSCVDHVMSNGNFGYPKTIIKQTIDYMNDNYRRLVEITPRIALRIADTIHYEKDTNLRNSMLQQMWRA
jgi:hypothetical protein